MKLYLPSFIFTAAEGWGENEICTKGVSDGQKEGERRGWDNRNPVPSPHRPLQIKHGRPNKRLELAMLRRPKK